MFHGLGSLIGAQLHVVVASMLRGPSMLTQAKSIQRRPSDNEGEIVLLATVPAGNLLHLRRRLDASYAQKRNLSSESLLGIRSCYVLYILEMSRLQAPPIERPPTAFQTWQLVGRRRLSVLHPGVGKVAATEHSLQAHVCLVNRERFPGL